jgi:hypothetical protein
VLKTIVDKLTRELNYDPFTEPAGGRGKGKDAKDKKKKNA